MTLDTRWHDAIRTFWEVRDQQIQRQISGGLVDAGTRGSVTGGKHLDALTKEVAATFRQRTSLPLEIRWGGRISLPGYYRRTKDWDLVVIYRGALVAAVELKSQVGSFGNNFNNRCEEAIGNAADVWRAHEAGLFGNIRPWLGFIMILELAPQSTTPLGDGYALFETDPAFESTTYLDRYRILLQRLVRDNQYDAAVVAAASKAQGLAEEPVVDLSFSAFAAAVSARLRYIESLPDHAFPEDDLLGV